MCPSQLDTVFGLTPDMMSSVAKVCRRRCRPHFPPPMSNVRTNVLNSWLAYLGTMNAPSMSPTTKMSSVNGTPASRQRASCSARRRSSPSMSPSAMGSALTPAGLFGPLR